MKHHIRLFMIIVIVIFFAASVLTYNYFSGEEIPETASSTIKTSNAKGGSRVTPVNIFIADNMVIKEGIRSMGSLVANEEVDITSEISGKAVGIFFEEGRKVKKGTILVKVNDDDLQSQLKRAVYQRNLLKDKLERNRILLDKDAISREAFDQIETDYNMVEADIQLLQVKIDKTEIRAPFDGLVGFRYISMGSYLQANTLIAKLVDYSKLKLEFSIPEKYISDKLNGMSITFTTENSTRINHAKVYAIDSKVDVKTRTITLRALYSNTDLSLRPGMFGKVTLGEKIAETIAIPTQAITSEASGKSVWIVKNNKAVLTPVVTATRTETMIEVKKGLSLGDSVITTGLMQIKDGAPVQINN